MRWERPETCVGQHGMPRTPPARRGSSPTSPPTSSARLLMRSRPYVLPRRKAKARPPDGGSASGSVISSRKRFASSYSTTGGCGTTSAGRCSTAEPVPGGRLPVSRRVHRRPYDSSAADAELAGREFFRAAERDSVPGCDLVGNGARCWRLIPSRRGHEAATRAGARRGRPKSGSGERPVRRVSRHSERTAPSWSREPHSQLLPVVTAQPTSRADGIPEQRRCAERRGQGRGRPNPPGGRGLVPMC
jgi:hypothetical protein